MPRVKWSENMPHPEAVAKLIERYIKIERRDTVEEALSRAGCSKGLYYRRLNAPEDFSLAELRRFGRALEIPQEELAEAVAAALRY